MPKPIPPPMPDMTPQALEAYVEALSRIEQCRQMGELGRDLDLSSLGLTTLPQEIDQLTALRFLVLHGNQLTTLPSEIGQLVALVSLLIYDNQLTTLPPEIGKLTALQELYVEFNQLIELPPQIGQMVELRHLSLDHNSLTDLPREIGQLSALRQLWVHDNYLTTLPPEMGQLRGLKRLDIGDNPLPKEILRLGKKHPANLLAYLRDLARFNKWKKDPTFHFNEAKLLLVGPGNVGKTWLLKALQGEVPRIKKSTKGMEIAREPMPLRHPDQPTRDLQLNCWDFGGQDNFQITHQIFFSAKAIYLLVWKPRTGIDPDLIARLERIQLSAGSTAKVMIVSTHADGNVPAVIGKAALKEQFGDLIWGFYETDSAKGAEGTGITELRAAIAEATAQLDGIDVPYPETWLMAQREICTLRKPTITFDGFSELCGKHGMDPIGAASLATIMEWQGRAVFFADASTDLDAGLTAAENLIVLDPEWLAKAVSFVLEDRPTMDRSGILLHERLDTIWKRDGKRSCPGYGKDLHGYLLWLMWRFDIAYKQSDQTSLLPELIMRNRPDDLRWTPALPARGEAEATLICRIPQDPPVGMIPALTAAVHPLRRVQELGPASDQLDRNWRDGFFLDTQSRGTAFVELQDRDLRIVVRDKYPSDLSSRIQRTMDEIIKLRWPRLAELLDVRVPCMGKVKGKPCPGTFRKTRLEGHRGKRSYCEDCDSEVDVNLMLEGFDPHEAAVMAALATLEQGQGLLLEQQQSLMAAAFRFFQQALDPARRELERAPTMLTIMPDKAQGWKSLANLSHHHFRVTCWCEHPDGPHPGAVIGSGDAPDYLLKMPKEWLVKASPYISWATTLVRAFVPMVSGGIGKGLDDLLSTDIKAELAMLSEGAKGLPTGKLELNTRETMETVHRSSPEIVALRHIHDALLEQVKKPKQWGNLRPVSTKSGELLWLCPEHAMIQQPPVQKL